MAAYKAGYVWWHIRGGDRINGTIPMSRISDFIHSNSKHHICSHISPNHIGLCGGANLNEANHIPKSPIVFVSHFMARFQLRHICSILYSTMYMSDHIYDKQITKEWKSEAYMYTMANKHCEQQIRTIYTVCISPSVPRTNDIRLFIRTSDFFLRSFVRFSQH